MCGHGPAGLLTGLSGGCPSGCARFCCSDKHHPCLKAATVPFALAQPRVADRGVSRARRWTACPCPSPRNGQHWPRGSISGGEEVSSGRRGADTGEPKFTARDEEKCGLQTLSGLTRPGPVRSCDPGSHLSGADSSLLTAGLPRCSGLSASLPVLAAGVRRPD